MTDMQDVTRQYRELAGQMQNLVRLNSALADLLNTKTSELSESFATRTRLAERVEWLEKVLDEANRKLDKAEPYFPAKESACVDGPCEDVCPPADNPYLRETALKLAMEHHGRYPDVSLDSNVVRTAKLFETYLSTPTEKETR